MADKKEEKKEETSPTPPSTEPKSEMIEVDKNVLEKILEKQKFQDEKAIVQEKEIKRLTAAADLGRLAKYDQEHQGTLIHVAKVATIEHKGKDRIVLGWKTIKDSVKIRNGILEEDQVSEYYLESDDPAKPFKVEMLQRQWYQEIGRIEGEIISTTTTPDGRDTRTLRFKDGKELQMDIAFINP